MAVATIQTNVSRLICVTVKILVMEGKPAISYSLPYLSIISQKWGICPMKKKKAIISALGSLNEPPAATHPASGGNAPTTEPGTTAKAVIRLR